MSPARLQPFPLAVLPDPAFALDGEQRVVAANPLAGTMYRAAPETLVGRCVDELLDDAGPLRAAVEAGRAVSALPLTGRRANGVPFMVDVSARVLDDGRLLCMLREADRARIVDEARRHFDVAFEQIPIGMALYNPDGEYVRVNDALCRFLARPAADLLGTRDQVLTHPDDRASDIEAAWRVLRGEFSTWQCEKRFVRPDGEIVWAAANLTFLRDEHGRPLCWMGHFQDITERRRQEGQWRRLAERDPLTDLLNRRHFADELTHALELMARDGGTAALLLIDLDDFKDVNDSHGHAAGDVVLCAVADILRARVRRGDFTARLGGDEFAVLLVDCSLEDAMRVADDVIAGISGERFPVARGCRISASVGVVSLPRDGIGTDGLMAAADRAMYDAKAVGGGRVRTS
jgi:diguanylate cyclase (GGDEF)-like protein/PAS domain S-box-containing protein